MLSGATPMHGGKPYHCDLIANDHLEHVSSRVADEHVFTVTVAEMLRHIRKSTVIDNS